MKRPKLFYTPGMISLLVLPVLLYIYQPSIKEYTVLRFILPKDDSQSPSHSGYTYSVVSDVLKGKKIHTIYLGEHNDVNEKKLALFAREALKLKFYSDTTQVVGVYLSEESTYGNFVQLVNIMVRDKHKRYTLIGDYFYVFSEVPTEL